MKQMGPEGVHASPATPVALIGFLDVEPTQDKGGFLGALMVLDERGYPMEFRCTTPVKPTPIQRLVYGPLLEQYVSVELCGKCLLGEVKRRPGIVLVPSPHLLSFDEGSLPVVSVQRAGEVIQVESLASGLVTERIESKAGIFQPIITTLIGENSEVVKAARSVLIEAFARFDLLEPFERIRTALKFLQEQDPKYR